MVGDGKGTALHLIGQQFVVAAARGQVVHRARHIQQRQFLRALDDRHDQALLAQRGGHADVDLIMKPDALVAPGGVHERVGAQRGGCGGHEVSREGQFDPIAREQALVGLAVRHHAAEVGFHHRGHVR